MLAFGPTPSVHAATITVSTNTAPLADDGFCSLTEAILNANSDSQIYTTVGECDAGSGPDIINLAGNTYTYLAAYNGSNSLPAINGELVIVNTKFCTLCTIEPDHSFNPFWRPSFVSALAPRTAAI